MYTFLKLAAAKPPILSQSADDQDGDGLTDQLEQDYCERFAPIIYHPGDEPNLPTNVDWFLSRTSLRFSDVDANIDQQLIVSPSQNDLHWIGQAHGSAANDAFDSYSWRDASKRKTFYLADLSPSDRRGPEDSALWCTYCHVYPNSLGGKTIQYWRFHGYNSGLSLNIRILGRTLEGGYHGGDWEGIQVALDSTDTPSKVRYLGHKDIFETAWAEADKEGDHVVIYSELGSHTSNPTGSKAGIRQETWKEGIITWPSGKKSVSGGLTNVGARRAAMNNQLFVYYSGLWGSPSQYASLLNAFPTSTAPIYESLKQLLYISSGYWGPAFNETGQSSGGLVRAWCYDMKVQDELECYTS